MSVRATKKSTALPSIGFPLTDRVLVERAEEREQTKGGIIIPDQAKDRPSEGVVVAVGQGKRRADGERITPDVEVGDRVVFGKHSGNEIAIEGRELVIMREEEILLRFPRKGEVSIHMQERGTVKR